MSCCSAWTVGRKKTFNKVGVLGKWLTGVEATPRHWFDKRMGKDKASSQSNTSKPNRWNIERF